MTKQDLQPVLTYPQLPVFAGYENVLKRVIFASLTTGKFKMFEQTIELQAGKDYESTAGFFCQLRERVGHGEDGQFLLLDITPKDSTVLMFNLHRSNPFDLRRPGPAQLAEMTEFWSLVAKQINNYRPASPEGI